MNTPFRSQQGGPILDQQPQPGPGNSVPAHEAPSPGAQIATTSAENYELRAQLEQLRAERNRLVETQRRLMELLGTTSPDKIVHDVRNVLNERQLLKALVDEL